MASKRTSIRLIARVCARCEFIEATLVSEISKQLLDGARPRWLKPFCSDLEDRFLNSPRPREFEVITAISENRSFDLAWDKRLVTVSIPNLLHDPDEMRPSFGAPQSWDTPPARTLTELANLLKIHIDDLGWITSQDRKTQHYLYRWHAKRSGSGRRLIEIPKPLLKAAQSTVLSEILETVPCHESTFAFQSGKSVFDFVNPHTGQDFVLKLDLKDFFPSITSGRVFRFFFSLGYPEKIASLLTRICTHSTPDLVLRAEGLSYFERQKFRVRHLPQGAPSSPALANLCAFRLDCRLSGLAKSAGANYSRYADDLLFSGSRDFSKSAARFHIAVLAIILEEGFSIHPAKSRFMSASQRQSAAGLVFNEKPNVTRSEYDQLKAILKNCQKHGWESQNRKNHPEFRAHLEGRIRWIAASNPLRGVKLLKSFEKIAW